VQRHEGRCDRSERTVQDSPAGEEVAQLNAA